MSKRWLRGLRTRLARSQCRSSAHAISTRQEPQALTIPAEQGGATAHPGPLQAFARSRAVELYGQFQIPAWRRLSADRLNLPGARIAHEYCAIHTWHPYGDTLTVNDSVVGRDETDVWPTADLVSLG